MKNVCQVCVLDLTYGTSNHLAYTPFRCRHQRLKGARIRRLYSSNLSNPPGLPVQVRDSLMGDSQALALTAPQSDVNKQWFAGQHDRMVSLLPLALQASANGSLRS